MIKIHSIKEKPGMGHNSQLSESAQEMVDAPHSEVTKAAIRGECEDVGGIAGKRLLSFLERVERVREEKTALQEDEKEIFAEAKGVGFDAKIMRKVLTLRKMDAEKRQEEDALLDLYKSAVGME